MNITIQQEKEICDHYKNKMDTTKLCKLFNLYPHNLYSILKKNNIEKRGPVKFKDINKIDDIINLVNNGMTIKSATKNVKMSKSTANKYLRRKGFKSPHPNGTFQTKYTLNENFLEKIDTSEK